MSDPWGVIHGITLTAVVTSVISHVQHFRLMVFVVEGRCPYCGYLRTHPIVKHDDLIVECGWD